MTLASSGIAWANYWFKQYSVWGQWIEVDYGDQLNYKSRKLTRWGEGCKRERPGSGRRALRQEGEAAWMKHWGQVLNVKVKFQKELSLKTMRILSNKCQGEVFRVRFLSCTCRRGSNLASWNRWACDEPERGIQDHLVQSSHCGDEQGIITYQLLHSKTALDLTRDRSAPGMLT